MKKLDIEQAESIRKKFAPDWEIRKNKYLYKKVAFNDYNQMLQFLISIEKQQVKLDHFANFMNFYNELTIAITTHDVGGLTQLDFELALYIDHALKNMDARKIDEDERGWNDQRRLKMYNPDGDMYMGKSMPGKGKKLPDPVDKAQGLDSIPKGSYEIDFDNLDREKLKKVVAKLIPTLGHKKNEMVLKARFGLAPFEKEYTFKQIADAMGVTPEVIRQREAKALRQLRHISRSRELRPFLDHIEEQWSDKYKKSINCNNPKGFSQKAHCAGRKK
jgi:pterin-4a-carbinolamine dehydratase